MQIDGAKRPPPALVHELYGIFDKLQECPPDPANRAKRIALKITNVEFKITPKQFNKYLCHAIQLTRGNEGARARVAKCREYAREHPDSLLSILLVQELPLTLAQFREILPLLNATLMQMFLDHQKAKKEAEGIPATLVEHLTKDHISDPCTACEMLTSGKELVEKASRYQLIQQYISFFLNYCETKLMEAREEIHPVTFITGFLAGALIGGLVAHKNIPMGMAPDDAAVLMLGGAVAPGYLGPRILHFGIRMATEPLLLDRPQFGDNAPWTVHSPRVRSRFQEISSGYICRALGLASLTLGEVEITFEENEKILCLFNMAEDWRIDGRNLFRLHELFLKKLDDGFSPADCRDILLTLTSTPISRGLLHFKVHGFFGSYGCFFEDIIARCQMALDKAKIASTEDEFGDGFDFVLLKTPSSPQELGRALDDLIDKSRTSLRSMAALTGRAGKFGFDPVTGSFYSTASSTLSDSFESPKIKKGAAWVEEVANRKQLGQSVETLVEGLQTVATGLISMFRVIPAEAKNPDSWDSWNEEIPDLEEQIEEAKKWLVTLSESYEDTPTKQAKIDKASELFTTNVDTALRDLKAQMKALGEAPKEERENRPLAVGKLFDKPATQEQRRFLTTFASNLGKTTTFITENKERLAAGAGLRTFKPTPELPWTLVVTPQDRIMLHFHMSPVQDGREPGSAFKTLKYGYCWGKNYAAKMTTRFDIAKLNTEQKEAFENAKREQGFLERIRDNPHPNVIEPYEVGWRSKISDGFHLLIQRIYALYARKGNLHWAWKQVIADDRLVEKLLKGLLDGLCHLHKLNIVHNDIKPTNIVLDEDFNPRLADFGLSRDHGTENVPVGTFNFADLNLLQSENLQKKCHPAQFSRDIRSLGALFFLLINKIDKPLLPWMPLREEELMSQAQFNQAFSLKDAKFPKPAEQNHWLYACWLMLNQPEGCPSLEVLKERLMDKNYPLVPCV